MEWKVKRVSILLTIGADENHIHPVRGISSHSAIVTYATT
jgi:hypothetical protein